MTYKPSRKKTSFGPKWYKDHYRVFTYILDRMMKQGKPSIASSGGCAYVTPDEETKDKSCYCAAGMILPSHILEYIQKHDNDIPDMDDPLNTMDFWTMTDDLRQHGIKVPYPLGESLILPNPDITFVRLISLMQNAHDAAAMVYGDFKKDFLSHCAGIAEDMNFSMEAINYYKEKLGITDPLIVP